MECSYHLAKESVRIIRVLFRLTTPFRMPVNMVLGCKDRRFIVRLRMDVKNSGFLVIDPNHCVRRHWESMTLWSREGVCTRAQPEASHRQLISSCRMRRWLFLTLVLPLSACRPALTKDAVHPAGGYVSVHGAKLWFESEGSGEPLVLISGGPGSSHDYFHPYFRPLADHYRIIYFDAFGRGKSDKASQPSEYSFERDVDDLEGLRQELKLGPISVFGHSYGGAVAQAYALKYPASVRSLILSNTFIAGGAARDRRAMEHVVEDYFPEAWDQVVALKAQPPSPERDAKIDQLMGNTVPAPMVYDYDPAKSDEFDSKHASFNQDVLRAIEPEVIALDFRDRLKTVKVPILVLAGRADRIAPPRLTRQFRTYAPAAQFVMFEHSGHDLFLEEPARLIQVLRPFLDTATKTAAPVHQQ